MEGCPLNIGTLKAAEFLFLGVNTPWVYALAAELAAQGHPTRVIATNDWLTYHRARPNWPPGEPPAALQREWWVQPPGYVGSFARFFAPWLRRKLRRSAVGLRKGSASAVRPWVIAPYPWFVESLRDVPGDRLIYYNLDDYTLYHSRRSRLIAAQEAELVQRAALTVCLSRYQFDALRKRFPERAAAIRHLPLGVVESYINPAPGESNQGATVGYVGNLIARVDWRLVGEVARAMSEVKFIFVGGLEQIEGQSDRANWSEARDKALALPNVLQVGPVRQEAVPEHYWNFGVNWIPYATDHAFNQAACPTKIMDGLASGRPVVSTDLQESRLYPKWITIARDADEMVHALRRTLGSRNDQTSREYALQQVEFTRGNTWQVRARTLFDWLSNID